ncbi:hypothetical protein E2C01_059629 [Portunus trituberculatus]|uniref:Uncharacterized protein n=1 Tax=Portunus trituberculatus TaxID=210409 RepID=A0A5B7H784_PORTR|nr:hypothetical protein [Portunus trituberculatus]
MDIQAARLACGRSSFHDSFTSSFSTAAAKRNFKVLCSRDDCLADTCLTALHQRLVSVRSSEAPRTLLWGFRTENEASVRR